MNSDDYSKQKPILKSGTRGEIRLNEGMRPVIVGCRMSKMLYALHISQRICTGAAHLKAPSRWWWLTLLEELSFLQCSPVRHSAEAQHFRVGIPFRVGTEALNEDTSFAT